MSFRALFAACLVTACGADGAPAESAAPACKPPCILGGEAEAAGGALATDDAWVRPKPLRPLDGGPESPERPPVLPLGGSTGPGPGTGDVGFFPAPDADLSDRPCTETRSTIRINSFEIFRFEASHPLATVDSAFPGASSTRVAPAPPFPENGPCSRAGVRPWHSVDWNAASTACQAAGWRLCTTNELVRACQGDSGREWTFGEFFDASACNLRQVFADVDGAASEAPTGSFPGCVSEDGVFDLSGNLWEWVSEAPSYLGGGWRIIAGRHREEDLTCRANVEVAGDFASPDVGFRCCRAAF